MYAERVGTARRIGQRSEFIVLTLAFFIGLVIMSIRAGFAVLYPAIASDLHLTTTEATGAFALSMPVYAVAVIGAGVLLDRLGIRTTMLLALAIETLGVGLAVGARDLAQLYLTWGLLMGIGMSGVGYVANLKLLAVSAPHLIGKGLGMLSAGQGVGALLISPALQLIVDLSGWRHAQAVLAIGSFGILLPLILMVAPGRERASDGASGNTDGMIEAIKRQPRAFALGFVALFAIGYTLLLPTHQVAYLANVGAPSLVAATVGGMMGGMMSLGGVVGGFVCERVGAPRLLLTGGIIGALGTVALTVASPDAPLMIALYLLGAGAGRGIVTVGLGSIQAQVFPGRTLGRISGLLEIGFGLGGFAGPWLTAAARDALGSYVPGLLTAAPAFLLISIAGLAAWGARVRDEGEGAVKPLPSAARR